MKNYILILALIIAFSMPQITKAEEPIFNRLMALFTQILGEKNAKIASLETRIKELERNPSIKIVEKTVEVPKIVEKIVEKQCFGSINPNQSQIDSLKKEYAIAINNIDILINQLQKEIDDKKAIVTQMGTGVTSYEISIANSVQITNTNKINSLTNQKINLQTELKKKLINLGEY